MLPRIFYSLRKAKNFLTTVPFMYTIFEAYLINPLRFSEVSFFPFHSPGEVIFRKERTPKIFGIGNAMQKGIRKTITFGKL